MIELVGVTKRFGGADAPPAVDGVSLRLGDRASHAERDATAGGHALALIGPSGCGKSTMLRLMIGLLTPTAGSVRFRGDDMSPTDWRRARRDFGYAIQSGGLFPHMTARDNVELPARHWGMARAARTARVDELAEVVHLPADALGRYPSELSGGQRQRVALMRALVMDPEILLLDEPLGALDPIIRAELQEELRTVIGSLGKVVVLVTHDLAEAAYLCGGDLALMRAGRVVQRGPFSELVASPAEPFVARFVRAQAERVRTLAGVAG
jgi:osmoprotectant transport system ATP-binding protein